MDAARTPTAILLYCHALVGEYPSSEPIAECDDQSDVQPASQTGGCVNDRPAATSAERNGLGWGRHGAASVRMGQTVTQDCVTSYSRPGPSQLGERRLWTY